MYNWTWVHFTFSTKTTHAVLVTQLFTLQNKSYSKQNKCNYTYKVKDYFVSELSLLSMEK